MRLKGKRELDGLWTKIGAEEEPHRKNCRAGWCKRTGRVSKHYVSVEVGLGFQRDWVDYNCHMATKTPEAGHGTNKLLPKQGS